MARTPTRKAADEPAPLVDTKLLVPPGRLDHFMRERLLTELDDLEPRPLTLVSAPVGFGKTVLLQSWCSDPREPVAWVSLDPGDDDPVRFLSYLATAIDRVRSGLGRLALSRLRSGIAVEIALDELLNGIAAFDRPVAIVLDDLHLVRSDVVLRLLAHMIDRLPQHARVVATTRSDPDLPLSRLRARGALGELRAHHLAFTFEEARTLLVAQEGIPLVDQSVELLVERTEGWPAGLYLAALWLRELDDPAAGVRNFHGDHRHVADYLTSEVLDTLDTETRDFLLRTSVLGRFDAELCDAVLDRDDARHRLLQLERSNLFVVPLDSQRRWYRYHHLFGELLELELATVDPSAPAALHRRASAWCRKHDLLDEALQHAAAAGDEVTIADLLVEHHRPLVMSGRQDTYLRWVRSLPSELVLERPVLTIAAALATRMLGLPAEEAHRYVALAERARDERPASWTPYEDVALRMASLGWIEDDVQRSIDEAQRTVEDALGGAEQFVVPALASLGLASFFAGDRERARRAAMEALDRPEAEERPHGCVYAHGVLAFLDAEDGDVSSAEVHASSAREVAARYGLLETTSGGVGYLAAAVAAAVSGRVRDAQHAATRAERLCRQSRPDATHVYALIALGEIQATRGELTAARESLDRARRAIDTFVDAGRLPELVARAEEAFDTSAGGTQPPAEPPSDAELSVLRLLPTGLSQREIGASLFISMNTVKTHTRSLYRKLGVATRDDAVARAKALGLLAPDDSPG